MAACSFTGHRPEKLPFPDEEHPRCIALKQQLFRLCEDMLSRGVTDFLSGMSRGVDMWAAECVLQLRSKYPDAGVRLWAIVPYAAQANGWTAGEQARYRHILAAADQVTVITESYFRGCLHCRNRFLVEHSQYLIAVYNGCAGGTYSTMQYARKKGVEVLCITP